MWVMEAPQTFKVLHVTTSIKKSCPITLSFFFCWSSAFGSLASICWQEAAAPNECNFQATTHVWLSSLLPAFILLLLLLLPRLLGKSSIRFRARHPLRACLFCCDLSSSASAAAAAPHRLLVLRASLSPALTCMREASGRRSSWVERGR